MTTFYNNASIREVLLGINVSRATAVPPTALQSPQTLFTITGGRILLVHLLGEVTTVIGGNAQTLKVSSLSSAAGSASLDLCTVSGSIATHPVGTHYALPNAVGSALADDHATLSGMEVAAGPRIILPAGVITLTSSATNTGSIKWDIIYIPLDTGSLVVAA